VFLLNEIVPLLDANPHTTYVEPFGGGASILLHKRPATNEVYNDLDDNLYALIKTLSDPLKGRQLQRRLHFTLHCRKLYEEARQQLKKPNLHTYQRAFYFYIVLLNSFARKPGHGFRISKSHTSVAQGYRNQISKLHTIINRLKHVTVEHLDFQQVITRYDSPSTIFYIDPPYHPDTRPTAPKCYHHEMSHQDHLRLTNTLLNIKGRAILSCYFHHAYQPLIDLKHYSRIDLKHTPKTLNPNNPPRTETLLIHPDIIKPQPTLPNF